MPQRLTKRVVDLAAPESADRFLWDSDLKGFGLKVTPAGRKSFVAQYRSRDDGRTQRLTIGAYGPLTVEQARSQARIVLGDALQKAAHSEVTIAKFVTISKLTMMHVSAQITPA